MLFCQLILIFNHKVHEVLRQAQDDNAKYTKFKRNRKFGFSRDGSGNPFINCHGFKPVAIDKRLKRTVGK